MPSLYKHQIHTRDHILEKKRALILNEPGTGKTASVLDAIRIHRKENGGGRALVFAPKSILEPAWVNDCRRFTPSLTTAAAYASNRKAAFDMGTDVVVTNHDAAKWVAANPDVLAGFDFLVLDESTAYKTRTSQRSKAVAAIKDQFDYRAALSGTPMPNGLIDIWHQAYLIDDGERLGARFFAFRAATHEPVPVTYDIQEWREKEGAREAVADLLADITVLYRMRDCLDIPPNRVSTREFELSKKLRRQYDEMQREAVLAMTEGEVKAVNAAVLAGKLLQIASGSVYGLDGEAYALDAQRVELVAQLCAERDHTLVAYQWNHQRDALLAAFKKAGIERVLVWDSADAKRLEAEWQAGKHQVLLAHPAQAGHGLTLTRAATVIWPSPTVNAEHFTQFNARIDRNTQTRETETILIQARDTIDVPRYAQLQGKIGAQDDLLGLLRLLTHQEAA